MKEILIYKKCYFMFMQTHVFSFLFALKTLVFIQIVHLYIEKICCSIIFDLKAIHLKMSFSRYILVDLNKVKGL